MDKYPTYVPVCNVCGQVILASHYELVELKLSNCSINDVETELKVPSAVEIAVCDICASAIKREAEKHG